MNLRILFFGLTVLAYLQSCSSMSLQVVSEPEQASVYVKKGKVFRKIGETPLSISARELGTAAPYNLQIQKQGYQTEQILIDERVLSASAEIYTNLKKTSEAEGLRGLASVGSQSAETERSLATIQSQLLQKNYDQAETLARGFLTANPFSAVGWNLLANSFLLQNRNNEALQAYQKAYEFDPENKETEKMIQYLKVTPQNRGR